MVDFQRTDITTIIQSYCYLILHAMHVDESIPGFKDISGELLDGHKVLLVDAVGADEGGS